MLESLFSKMAAIESPHEMTELQVAAQSGSQLLRNGARPIPPPPGSAKSAMRLLKAIDGTGLVAQFLVLIVQRGLKNSIYAAADERSQLGQLKMLSDAYDKAQDVWLQYLVFLEQHMDPDALSAALPSLPDLIEKHRFLPSEAFTSLRSVLRLRYSDVASICEGATVESVDAVEPGAIHTPSVLDHLLLVFPSSFPPGLSRPLYAAFWSLRLSDVRCPKEAYEEVNKKLQKRHNEIDLRLGGFDDWDAAKKAKELEKIRTQQSKLEDERVAQEGHVAQVRAHFRQQAAQWLKDVTPDNRNGVVLDLLQHCIFPRCRTSAEDAIFCAEFFDLLQDSGTSYFATVQFCDTLTVFSSFLVSSSTECEAAHLGRFFGLVIGRVNGWRSSEENYNHSCRKSLGFSKDFKYEPRNSYSYDEYLERAFKWHRRLTLNLSKCLDSKEYLVQRNGLVVLTRMVEEFPFVDSHAVSLKQRVQAILERSAEMSDLRLLATRYDALLRYGNALRLLPPQLHIC